MHSTPPTDPEHAAPTLSVVIPTCNRAGILARCLQALAEQTLGGIEVVVVDDVSSDSTPQMLERFAADHPDLPLTSIRNESHIGANPSRNRGVRVCKSDLVAFIDSDCIVEPDWAKQLVKPFADPSTAGVVGLVLDPDPKTIWDLTFRGTHRVAAHEGEAKRIVAGNLALRRSILSRIDLDEDAPLVDAHADKLPTDRALAASGRVDEEGLHLALKASGLRIVTAPAARLLHEHYYDRPAFFRQAYRGGRAAAKLVYKYRLPQRRDMLPFVLAYAALPLALINIWLLAIPLFFFAGALAAITYNDLFLKGKTLAQTIFTFPTLLMYYHLRLIGYVQESVRLRVTKHDLPRAEIPTIIPEQPG
jgi:glycosyltransferase involved in cell wall biosynthesis